MIRTLLSLALASGLGAQPSHSGIPAGPGGREDFALPWPVAQQFGAQTMMEANRQTPLAGRANHGSAERPGWWQRHLGDTAIHAAATSADAATSWGRVELNPLLRSADGRFGARGLGIKLAIFGGVELVKWSLIRKGHRGRWVRSLSLAPAAAFGVAAARNGVNR